MVSRMPYTQLQPAKLPLKVL